VRLLVPRASAAESRLLLARLSSDPSAP
jgi:hypothetical protein